MEVAPPAQATQSRAVTWQEKPAVCKSMQIGWRRGTTSNHKGEDMSRYANKLKDGLYDELEYRYDEFKQDTEGLTFLDWLSMFMEVLTDFIKNKAEGF